MTAIVICGDASEKLRSLPGESVHCCVTSPPYFGLRNYGVEGQIGVEPTPAEYVESLVNVFREVRRVLRRDGTLWVVIGDSYSGSWGARGRGSHTNRPRPDWELKYGTAAPNRKVPGIKPKDLIGIPWMLAFALRSDGWYLRQDIVWHKPNAMPESVRDRCTRSHEYVFLLSRGRRYYYDAEAVAEPATWGNSNRPSRARGEFSGRGSFRAVTKTRNRRDVWSINTTPHSDAHFAIYPDVLVEQCVMAGTSEAGVCGSCGSPIVRIVSRRRTGDGLPILGGRTVNEGGQRIAASGVGHWRDASETLTLGWRASCGCAADVARVPAVVLDPFSGSGTTGLVAESLGRDSVLIDINPEYVQMARDRIGAAGRRRATA